MRNKLYWGIATLIVLLIAVGGFMFVRQWQEIQQLKQEAAQDDKLLQDNNPPIVSSDKPITIDDLPAADPGFKWVQHGDHFHQVPLDAPDEWQGETHEPNIENPNAPQQKAPSSQNFADAGLLDKMTYKEYEKYVTDAWKNLKRDKFGFPIKSDPTVSRFPIAPRYIDFPTTEEDERASELWSRLLDEEGHRTDAAILRQEAYHAQQRKEAGLND